MQDACQKNIAVTISETIRNVIGVVLETKLRWKKKIISKKHKTKKLHYNIVELRR